MERLLQDMVLVQYFGGMRPSEMLIMRPCDIEFAGDIWKYVPTHHKNEKKDLPRLIFLGPKAQAILQPHLQELGAKSTEYIFSPIRAHEMLSRRLRATRKTKSSLSSKERARGIYHKRTAPCIPPMVIITQ